MKTARRSLATVLFTDIVGSTERAAGLRDAGWREMRQEHDRRVRRELKRFGGREINTGYGLWKRGRSREALSLLIAGQRNMVGYAYPYREPPRLVCWWIGLLFLELDKPEEAIPYLHQAPDASLNPYVAYDMARAYAGAGKNREAIDRYQYALTAWRNADPVLRPRIDTARREIARLGGFRE